MLRARICIWASLSYLSVKFIIKLIIVRWEAQPSHITAISKRSVSDTVHSCKSTIKPQKSNTFLSWLSLWVWNNEKYPVQRETQFFKTPPSVFSVFALMKLRLEVLVKDSASVDKVIAERVTLWLIECVKEEKLSNWLLKLEKLRASSVKRELTFDRKNLSHE